MWIVCKPRGKRAAAKLGGQQTKCQIMRRPRNFGDTLSCTWSHQYLAIWRYPALFSAPWTTLQVLRTGSVACTTRAWCNLSWMGTCMQALKRLHDKADSSGEIQSEFLNIFELFRPLASDIIAEANHHENRCPSRVLYPEKCDYVMVPALPNHLPSMLIRSCCRRPITGVSSQLWQWRPYQKLRNNLQERPLNTIIACKWTSTSPGWSPQTSMTTAATLPISVFGSPRGQFLGDALFHRTCVCIYVLLPRAHFRKDHFYVIHDYYYVIQAPL